MDWRYVILIAMAAAGWGCNDTLKADRLNSQPPQAAQPVNTNRQVMTDKMQKTDAEWRQTLTPEQYEILRQKGTERAFTGKYWDHHEAGVYRCAGCGQELFVSDTKFDSGCGWPSFYAPADQKTIETQEDRSHGMHRTEVLCSRCNGHLGHVFTDGPKPTGLRYCINSASIDFQKKQGAPEAPKDNTDAKK